MSGRIRSLAIAEGFSFGRDGRYAVLNVLGRGWEGEVYGVADTLIEGRPNVKAVKFSSVVSDDYAVAPTWSSEEIRTTKNVLFDDIPQGLLWYAVSECKEKWKQVVDDVKQRALLLQKAANAGIRPLLPLIEDYGIVILPCDGNLLPFLYEIMPLVPGSTLPVVLSTTTAYVEIAEKCLDVIVSGICDHYSKGFLIGSDIHIENVMYNGEEVHLLDVHLEQGGSVKELRESISATIALAYHIANWDSIGLCVSAHVQNKIHLCWLDNPLKLEGLTRKLSLTMRKKIKNIVLKTQEKAWPCQLW